MVDRGVNARGAEVAYATRSSASGPSNGLPGRVSVQLGGSGLTAVGCGRVRVVGCFGVLRAYDWRASPVWVSPSAGVLWRCPTLPQPVGCSTIGAAGLSFQVRNGDWAFPRCYDHHKTWCSTRCPTTVLFGGVWVDRGSYSGCGIVLLVGCFTQRVVGCLFSVGPLVPVGSRAPRGASTSGLSTR